MYQLMTTERFEREFKKLDGSIQNIVKKWISKNLTNIENPHLKGRALRYNLKDYWRYRIGDYRLIAEIREDEVVIIAISIAHRSRVYQDLED